MRNLFGVFVVALCCAVAGGSAKASETVGIGRLLSNDSLATVEDDRWRTGSAVISAVRAKNWDGRLPSRVGDLLEFRFRGEVITPQNIVSPAPGDRPYAAALSLGLHTHFELSNIEYSLGADVVVTGPQTGLATLQSAIHDVLGVPGASSATLSNQISNGVHANFAFEAGRRFDLSENLQFRPFLELQAGPETLARVGGDFHFGKLARNEVMLRDVVTGHRYRFHRDQGPGWAAVIGADFAYIADSLYLPASLGVAKSDTRSRARLGVHWQNNALGVFYGVTWLGKEFNGQSEGQVLGSIRIDIVF